MGIIENKEQPPYPFDYKDTPLFCEVDNCIIQFKDIALIFAEDYYSRVITRSRGSHLVRRSLKKWEQKLPPGHFFRIRRNVIVRVALIEWLVKLPEGCKVKINGFSKLERVSRSRLCRLSCFLKTLRCPNQHFLSSVSEFCEETPLQLPDLATP